MALYGKLTQAAVLQKIIKRCRSSLRKNKNKQDGGGDIPVDVPEGHFVVYVSENRSRYIVPLTFLSNPQFQTLLQMAEQEFGFNHQMGLTIPCHEHLFLSILPSLT